MNITWEQYDKHKDLLDILDKYGFSELPAMVNLLNAIKDTPYVTLVEQIGYKEAKNLIKTIKEYSANSTGSITLDGNKTITISWNSQGIGIEEADA